VVTELLQKCVEENAHSALNQVEYEERYTTLAERYENIKKRIEDIDDKRIERSAKRKRIEAFMQEFEHRNGLVTEFDEEL
jgi:site-specific DNA recombinase